MASHPDLSADFLRQLPPDLNRQIINYLNKQTPAICEIEEDRPDKDDYVMIYTIKRNGKIKFHFSINKLWLQTKWLNHLKKFLKCPAEGPVSGTIFVELEEQGITVFNIAIYGANPEYITFEPFYEDTELVSQYFSRKYYKAAFDTMLKDLYERICTIMREQNPNEPLPQFESDEE